jgi:hypothetical protein
MLREAEEYVKFDAEGLDCLTAEKNPSQTESHPSTKNNSVGQKRYTHDRGQDSYDRTRTPEKSQGSRQNFKN